MTMKPILQSVAQDVLPNDQMMGSQSSLDDAIASMCTDDLMGTECSNGNLEQTEVEMQQKNNKVVKDNLQQMLDDDEDEDFLALNY